MRVGCDPFVGSLCLCAVYGPTSHRLVCSLAVPSLEAVSVCGLRPTTNPSGVLLSLAACRGSFVWVLCVFLNEGSRILDVMEALCDDKILAC